MKSTLDGAASQPGRSVADAGRLPMPVTLAATTESIHWTQTRYERMVALRHERIAIAAYLISEARGFEPGHEAEDWLAAESRINAIDSGTSQA